MVISEFYCATLSMSNVNADCNVEIIISGIKLPVLLNEVFIKNIQYRIIFRIIIASAPIIIAPINTSALTPSIPFFQQLNSTMKDTSNHID